MIAPNSLFGQILSLMLVCLGLSLAWSIAFSPAIANLNDRQTEVSLLKTRHEKLSALVVRGMPEDPFANIKTLARLEAPSRAGAQAALQSIVRTMALEEGINVRSISATNAETGDVAAVSIAVSAETDMDSLVNFLFRVRETEEQMWSQDLDIRSNDWSAREQAQTRMDFRIVILASWRNINAGDLE